MNLLERILAADWTRPEALALLASLTLNVAVWLRWGWRTWQRLRATPDPTAHDDYEDWRTGRDPLGARDKANRLRAEYEAQFTGPAFRLAETASERQARLTREAIESDHADVLPAHLDALLEHAEFDEPGQPSAMWTSRAGVQALRAVAGKPPLSEAELDALFDPESGCYRIDRP